jgi:hypothetical protein
VHVDFVQVERSFLRLIGILSIKVSDDDDDDNDYDYDYRCGGSIITSFYLVVNVVDSCCGWFVSMNAVVVCI